MPSAAIRQRLPAELWKYPQPGSKSPVPSHSSQIQAHPGGSDFFEASTNKHRNPSHHNVVRRQFTPSNKKRTNLQRRGSSDDILNHSDTDLRSESNVRVSVSACSDSECGVSYNSTTDCRDLYATDSFKAPDESALPLPPTQWLGSFPPKINGNDHAMNKASLQLQAFLGLVPNERRV